ncbi:hypothetical protein L195_g041478, partial [Trifolium pratense]
MCLNLGPGNCTVVAGRCFDPLTKPSTFCTFFLLFSGETSLVGSLEGEKDPCNFDGADLFGELLLKHTNPSLFLLFGGELKHVNPSLFCTLLLFFVGAVNLEGEIGRLDFDAAPHLFDAAHLLDFDAAPHLFGEFNLVVLLGEGGDLLRNLCGDSILNLCGVVTLFGDLLINLCGDSVRNLGGVVVVTLFGDLIRNVCGDLIRNLGGGDGVVTLFG